MNLNDLEKQKKIIINTLVFIFDYTVTFTIMCACPAVVRELENIRGIER